MPSRRNAIPNLAFNLSYETAASLQHIMLAAYHDLEREKPELYAETMSQTKGLFDYLSAYIDKHS